MPFYLLANSLLENIHISRRLLTFFLSQSSYFQDYPYITWFDGFEVPIINQSSYSDEDGKVNTMIAPVRTMRGDTATIHYGYWDNWRYEDTYGDFKIIFDLVISYGRKILPFFILIFFFEYLNELTFFTLFLGHPKCFSQYSF